MNTFDETDFAEYAQKAEALWGDTSAYAEYKERTARQTPQEQQQAQSGIMDMFAEFGQLKEQGYAPESEIVQTQVKKLQDYITQNFYTCTDEILAGLGQMYGAGGDFTTNIDAATGAGTAMFSADAIKIYCK